MDQFRSADDLTARSGSPIPTGRPDSPDEKSMHTPPVDEKNLAAHLQPIRGFVLAHAIFYFMDSGLLELIAASSATVHDLAERLGLHKERLRGLLYYLANEGLVEISADSVAITGNGREINKYRPWYTLMVGGYSRTLDGLGESLKRGGPYGKRNSNRVGKGSCGISQYDAIPMTQRLLRRLHNPPSTIVDLGCGDGSYLLELCRAMPDARGIGVDSDPSLVAFAQWLVERSGVGHRVKFEKRKATDIRDLPTQNEPVCFVAAFLLQEILEQSGREAIVQLLSSTRDRYACPHWIVIEVDHRPDNRENMETGLGLAYYNPYYLVHQLTEQRLETAEFWKDVFRDAHFSTTAVDYPEPSYDSLQLKIGFLLTPEK